MAVEFAAVAVGPATTWNVAATLDSLKNVYATVDAVVHTGTVTIALEQFLATMIDEETALRC